MKTPKIFAIKKCKFWSDRDREQNGKDGVRGTKNCIMCVWSVFWLQSPGFEVRFLYLAPINNHQTGKNIK